MPISGEGWELYIVRQAEQRRSSDGRRRTVGRYQVYRDGAAQTGSGMSGMFAEAKGPGANVPKDNGKRIEQGRYPLWTHPPGHYATVDYSDSTDPEAEPKPCLELKDTGDRYDILVHPGDGFLSSVGCINLCTSLPDAEEPITYSSSRRRVIAVMGNLKNYLGANFPDHNGERIPRAFVVVDGEP
jgi:hypothetical protein